MKRGRKRPAGAEHLMKQVSEVFLAKKASLGAREAAKRLGVSVAAFYKYINKENLPDMEVLLRAKEEWGVKWDYLDPAEVLRKKDVANVRQLVFTFLEAIEKEDIKVVEVSPDGTSVLQISFKIKFPVNR